MGRFVRGCSLNGAPAGIRTRDLCFRKAPLYPAELRARNGDTLRTTRPARQEARISWATSFTMLSSVSAGLNPIAAPIFVMSGRRRAMSSKSSS